MNNEKQPLDLKKIIIPAREYLAIGVGPDKVIPVEPRNDDWLIATSRSKAEVSEAIQARIESGKSSIESQIDISGKGALLLSLIELNFEYSSLQYEHERKAALARSDYEQEKKRIKTLNISTGKQSKLMKDSWVTFEPQVVEETAEADKSRKLQEMVLSQSILQIFSIDQHPDIPLAVNLGETIEEVKNVVLKHKELFSGLIKGKGIDSFIRDLANHLVTVRDQTLFSSYRYRNSPDIISTPEDARILSGMIELATTEGELNNLGRSYLEFLVHRAGIGSLVRDGKEKYPHIQLLYDVVTASLYKGRGEVSSKLESIVDKMFESVTRTPVMQKECHGYMSQFFNNLSKFAEYYYNLNKEQRVKLRENIEQENFDNLPDFWVEWVMGTETRLQTLGSVTAAINSVATKRIDKIIKNFVPKRNKSLVIPEEEIEEFFLLIKKESGSTGIHKARGITLDLVKVWGGNYRYLLDRDTGHQTNLALKVDRGEMPSLEPVVFLGDEKVGVLPGIERLSIEEVRNLENENRKLWKEVLNNSKWFVSPRGDRFLANQDMELAESGITSITFNVNKKYPREHKIICQNRNGDTDTFWLDINHNLLDENREIVIGDPRITTKLENMFLKRLYYITSGVLSVPQDRDLTEGILEGKVLEYRRAYYAKLKSTERRKITMESDGAVVHAEEVLKDYGIDIYKEIQRRRDEGTLKQDEFITFVREVVPAVIAETARPNDINYDPTLIHI